MQFFLHIDFHGQSVSIPTSLTLHLEALHGLIAVESVLDGACENMVNTWVAIGRGGTLEEYELGASLTFINTFVEDIVFLPLRQDLLVRLGQIQSTMFGKFLSHNLF